MKLTVKTLKGSHFEIRVQPGDTIMAVKKNIEDVQGKDNYPCGQQLLIHNGKVLKDESTLDENKVSEDGFLVVMLSKTKTLASGSSSAQPTTTAPTPAPTSAPTPAPISTLTPAPVVPSQAPAPVSAVSASDRAITEVPADAYGQAASNLVAGNTLEQTIQQLMDMGGGSWDKDTVTRALRAAYNNPERAVDYLYSGIPASTEVAVPVQGSGGAIPTEETGLAGATPLSGIPNSSPLNMFPQEAINSDAAGGDGSLDFLRNNQQVAASRPIPGFTAFLPFGGLLPQLERVTVPIPFERAFLPIQFGGVAVDPVDSDPLQFQTLRSMVQANPQILQPMLQELSKQNPQLLRLIQEHHAEFLQLINEPLEGAEGDLFEQPEQDMPHAISVTPAEQEAIERLEAMGFDRALVIEAFLACDRNEEFAVNYLLEHAGDYDD